MYKQYVNYLLIIKHFFTHSMIAASIGWLVDWFVWPFVCTLHTHARTYALRFTLERCGRMTRRKKGSNNGEKNINSVSTCFLALMFVVVIAWILITYAHSTEHTMTAMVRDTDTDTHWERVRAKKERQQPKKNIHNFMRLHFNHTCDKPHTLCVVCLWTLWRYIIDCRKNNRLQ